MLPVESHRAYANAASIRHSVSQSIERARQALLNTVTPPTQSPATVEEPPYVFPFQDVEELVEPEPDPTDGLIPIDTPYVDPSEIPAIETTESMEAIYRSLQEPLPYPYPESPPAEDLPIPSSLFQYPTDVPLHPIDVLQEVNQPEQQ